MAKFVQLKDTKTGEAIYPITALPNEFTNEDIEAICDFEEGMDEDDVIPKATKDLLGCVVVGDGLDVDENGVLSNGWKMELLWQNASPTSAFSPQTISLELSEYYGVIVTSYVTNSIKLREVAFSEITPGVANGFLLSSVYGTNGKIYGLYRVLYVTTEGVQVSNAYETTPSADANTTSAQIPYQIYGIKGVS